MSSLTTKRQDLRESKTVLRRRLSMGCLSIKILLDEYIKMVKSAKCKRNVLVLSASGRQRT